MNFPTFALAGMALSATCLALGARAQDFSTVPQSPGSWSYTAQAGASESRFMDSSGTIRLFVRCILVNRAVTISRTSAAPASSLTIWTDSMQRTVPATFEANAMRVTTSMNARDPLLDAIAFSRGRVAVSMPGSPPLVVVAGAEAARVFEDCRN